MRVIHSILSAAVVASLLAPTAQAKFISKSLSICDQGSFFVGGVPKTSFYSGSRANPNANANSVQITIGQMYVSFQKPSNTHKVPVVLWHGSTHSGACVESTPQQTEGWRDWTVRKGLSTYVVDQAGRGRSGNDNSIVNEQAHDQVGNATALNYYGAIGRITDNGSWTSWFGHLVLPGTATDTGNITGKTFSGASVTAGELQPHGWRCGDSSPSTGNNGVHPDACTPAGMYGPAYAISGAAAVTTPEYPINLIWLGPNGQGPLPVNDGDRFHLNYYKQLIANYETTLPTSTCPGCSPQGLAGANTWSPFDAALLLEKIGGAIVGVHSQSGLQGFHMVRVMKERGHLDLVKGMIDIEGTCALTTVGLTADTFDNIPTLFFSGDYRVNNDPTKPCYNDINARRIAGFGTANTTYIKLDDPMFGGKFNGVTHMMMDGTNAIEVMDLILDWSSKYVTNPLAGSNIECGNAFLPPN